MKVTSIACDECHYVQTEEPDEIGIFKCKICKKDICDKCQDEHAKEHCGWNG